MINHKEGRKEGRKECEEGTAALSQLSILAVFIY
jgi:hypothetical protein